MKKLIFALSVAFLLPTAIDACTIPVFRYALEKWDLSTYEIVVFHRGALPADLKARIDHWAKPGRANVEFTLVDLDSKLEPKLQKLWDKQKGAQAPWMVVRYPQPKADHFTMWAGPANRADLDSLFDSPKRQEILNHLKSGSSVFLLLNSGDEKADKASQEMALAELQSLEKKIKLPEQSKDGPQMKLPLPLKVSLPLLTLDRNKAGEAMFVKLLLATEEDLDQVKGPILFALFGRGRVLGSLYGKELTNEQLREVTKFLCRECSCQVKELNPGIDMLMPINWEEVFNKMFDRKEPASPEKPKRSESPVSAEAEETELTGTEDETPTTPVTPDVEQPMQQTPIPTTDTRVCCRDYCPLCENWQYIAIAGASILVLGAGGWLTFTLLRK